MPIPSEWVAQFIDSGLVATKKDTVIKFLRQKQEALLAEHVELSDDFPPGSLILEFTRAVRVERARRRKARHTARKKAGTYLAYAPNL